MKSATRCGAQTNRSEHHTERSCSADDERHTEGYLEASAILHRLDIRTEHVDEVVSLHRCDPSYESGAPKLSTLGEQTLLRLIRTFRIARTPPSHLAHPALRLGWPVSFLGADSSLASPSPSCFQPVRHRLEH